MQFLTESLNHPYIPMWKYICDCINGIFCMGDDTHAGFVLWNPAIGEYTICVFGYDHNSNDYKLVRITSDTNYDAIDYVDEILHPIVHVYTLCTEYTPLLIV